MVTQRSLENAYRRTNCLSFGLALESLCKGYRVGRKGWNGKGMYLYLVPAGNYQAKTKAARTEHGDQVPYGPYIAIKTVGGEVLPWVASQADLLTDDWEIID